MRFEVIGLKNVNPPSSPPPLTPPLLLSPSSSSSSSYGSFSSRLRVIGPCIYVLLILATRYINSGPLRYFYNVQNSP